MKTHNPIITRFRKNPILTRKDVPYPVATVHNAGIVKHNDRMLSAYAHNRARRVAEGDTVRGGQVIATLGRNERDDPVLHFEIRRDGQPVDPTGFLPQR